MAWNHQILEDDLICKNLNALQPPDDNLPILYGRAGHGRGAGQGERKKVTSPDSGLAVISWGCFFYQKSNFIFILGCNEPIQSSVIQPDDPSSQNLKGIKARHLECTLGPSIGCMKFLFSKEFITIQNRSGKCEGPGAGDRRVNYAPGSHQFYLKTRPKRTTEPAKKKFAGVGEICVHTKITCKTSGGKGHPRKDEAGSIAWKDSTRTQQGKRIRH